MEKALYKCTTLLLLLHRPPPNSNEHQKADRCIAVIHREKIINKSCRDFYQAKQVKVLAKQAGAMHCYVEFRIEGHPTTDFSLLA